MRHVPRSLLFLIGLATVAFAPAAARAGGASILGQFNFGTAATTGEIGGEMDAMNFPIMNLGVGFRTRHVGLLATGDMMAFNAHDPTVDGRELLSFGGGVEVAGFYPLARKWELYGRAGRKWRWMGSSEVVVRTCNQTGTCAGGFWPEEPSYSSAGLTAALGMQRTFSDKGLLAGLGLEVRVEQVSVPLPGRGTVGGTIVFAALNFYIGGGGFLR